MTAVKLPTGKLYYLLYVDSISLSDFPHLLYSYVCPFPNSRRIYSLEKSTEKITGGSEVCKGRDILDYTSVSQMEF